MTIRVALDAMGGDLAPRAIIAGGLQSLASDPLLELTLVGDEDCIHAELEDFGADRGNDRLHIVHASQVVAMDAAPIEALRAFPDSSLVKMIELAGHGDVDAVISAGNTGAFAAAAQLKLKPLHGVTRPGIAVAVPAYHGPFVLCDVGANIQAKPRHLFEYAIMASLYAEVVLGIDRPRVALMSIGEESGKGTSLIKETHALLLHEPSVNFVGNAEGRELFLNKCDVAICDGFIGNIVLKFVEGLAEGLFQTISREIKDEDLIDYDRVAKALDRVWKQHDYSRYGGAPLLGINGACVICHGRSNDVAISHAITAARRFVDQRLNEAIVARLAATKSPRN